MKPLIVGERPSNARLTVPEEGTGPPRFEPLGGDVGARLAKWAGLSDLSDRFTLVNLFDRPGTEWSSGDAAAAAWRLVQRHQPRTLILLGGRVGAAMGMGDAPWFEWQVSPCSGRRAVVIPHPQGRCRLYTNLDFVLRASAVLQDAL